MCIYDDDNVTISDYDIFIDTEYYNHDYDEISIEEQEETNQTDILFE